jgi:hypothetical protein
MKTFIKYDFYFQMILYVSLFLWSILNQDFNSYFAISLFFIGCSQTISYIIRVGVLDKKNVIFNIYTFGYCVFLISIFIMLIAKSDSMFWFVTILVNLMAILFLISSFLDYKKLEFINL